MTKLIKPDQWSISILYKKIENKELSKPKYQRKKKWLLAPNNKTKGKTPNIKEYIEFLLEHGNSVHSITLAKDGNTYYNIDGNNRINAIITFLKTPFLVFTDVITKIESELNEKSVAEEIIKILMEELKIMCYNEFLEFDIRKYFDKPKTADIWKKITTVRDTIQDIIDKFKPKLMCKNSEDRFDKDVSININLFDGYGHDELSHVFTQINKFNTNLTENEIQASLLFNIDNIEITDIEFRRKVTDSIKEFYTDNSSGEVLECYQFDESSTLNAFDFIVGLQITFSKQYSFIEEVSNSNILLFFKLYKLLCVNKTEKGDFTKDSFTKDQVDKFIEDISESCKVLKETNDDIFTEKINDKLFNKTCGKKIEKLNSDRMFLLISSIIGFKKQRKEDTLIKNEVSKCILYNFLLNDISDKDTKEKFRSCCSLSHNGGGILITNEANKLLNTPSNLTEKITSEVFRELIEFLYNENRKDCIKRGTRKKLKFFQRTLMFYYYKLKVSCAYLKKEFSVEHIIPFSSYCDSEIDIDRTGNLLPIINELNCGRGNKSIKYYTEDDKYKEFCGFFKNILPNNENYNSIVNHDSRKPQVTNINAYNSMCSKNENEYLNNFISAIF